MISSMAYSGINPDVDKQLQQHITDVFGHVAFVQEREWAKPDWVLVKYEQGEIATFCNIVLRNVTMDGENHLVAGINNVITPAKFRGKGLATQVLEHAAQFMFGELACRYGLLLCADDLVPFYSRLNWFTTTAALYYNQPSGKQLYDSNVMLLTPPQQPPVNPQHIDLNGLPW